MLERHVHSQDIFEIRLSRPPVNALSPELLYELKRAIDIAPAEGAKALVLSGRAGVFSAGLDVPHLITLNHADLERAWQSFFDVCAAIARSPVPVVAALTGHAPAGGAVISLYCDYRVMAEGPHKIGLNEVQVGLVVPEPIQYALRRVVGTYRAERLMVSGAMIDAADAHRIGLVDQLAPVDQVVATSVNWLKQLLALPRAAMLGTRALARADLVESIADPKSLNLPVFLEAWFKPETQTALQAMIARVKNR